MTTKEQERKALEKIKKIVEDLGEQSYIGTAFEGCFDLAEQNIEYDAALAIGMPEATFRTKVQDRSFYVEEAFYIKENLFPELDFKYLFKKSDEESQ